jgi:uncharacterized membrane protein
MDSAQDIALAYSISSSSLFPSISYTGRIATDPLNTMETEASIVSGTGSQSDTSNRWGDYTSMAIDPSDDCTFWYTAEYYQVTATFDWSTRLASLKFPNCGGAADFTISANPTSVTVAQGNQGTSTISIGSTNGFGGSVALSSSGAPSGVTVTFNPTSVTAPGSSLMTMAVASTTTPGSYPITVTGTSGTLQHSTSVTLTVTSAGTFTISANPTSVTVAQGSQGSSTITTAVSGGFNSSITLSASGTPSGVTVGFNPNPIPAPGSGTSTMTITVASTTTPGTYPITVTGNGGGVQQSTTVTLTVTAGPNFTLTATPPSQSIRRGSQANYTATVTAQNGFSGTVSLSLTGCPPKSTCSFNPPSINTSGNSTLTVSTGSKTSPGTYNLAITGTSGTLQHSTSVSLTVTSH